MNKLNFILLRGYPSAGKTTFAENFIKSNPDYVLISADKIREKLYGSQDSYGNSNEVYKEILREMNTALWQKNKSVLYDAVNLSKNYRLDFMQDVIFPVNTEKSIITIPTCKEVCIERHLNRNRNIPIEKIIPYFSNNEEPKPIEGWDNIWTACSMAYIASPFFEPSDRENAIKAAEILRAKGIEVYLPLEHKVKDAWDLPNYKWGEEVFKIELLKLLNS